MRRINQFIFSVLLCVFGAMAQAQGLAVEFSHRRSEGLLAHLIRTARTQELAAQYAAALAKAQRKRPFQLQGTFSLLPSTNVNRAPTAKTFSTLAGDFEINDGGDNRSGLGLSLGVGATYRRPISNAQTLQITGQIGRTHYDDEVLRYWSGQLGAEVIDRQRQRTFRYGTAISRTKYDAGSNGPSSRPDAWRYALTASQSQDFGALRQTVGGQVEYRNYVTQDARDGPFATVEIDWSMAIGGRGQFRWGLGIERHVPKLAYQRNLAISAQIGYGHKVTGSLRVGATLAATVRRYDTEFATLDFARADDVFEMGVFASDTRIRIAGAVPTLSCNYTDHGSNVALYATSYTDCSVRFSFSF